MNVLQGIDIVSVKRMQRVIESQGDAFIKRVFTRGEHAYCKPKRMKYEHYAARFAAKEAFIKAVKVKKYSGFEYSDIEVKKRPSGKPYLHLSAKLKKQIDLPPKTRFDISLAHERDHAIATVLAIVPEH